MVALSFLIVSMTFFILLAFVVKILFREDNNHFLD